MGPWACGPLGLIAMSPNPISAAGAIRSQPCFWIHCSKYTLPKTVLLKALPTTSKGCQIDAAC